MQQDNLTLKFHNPFDLEKYNLFLKVKNLPEYKLDYDWQTDTYSIATHKRFAKSLELTTEEYVASELPISDFLFDYQKFIVREALAAKRYAIYADCGLGKTAMLLEFARHVVHKTGGKVLIFSPLQIIPQTIEEAERFYNGALPVHQIRKRDELIAWLKDDRTPERICITNYEKMIEGEIRELNFLAGLIADESSIFKTGGGVIKWNILHSINSKSGMAANGVEYRLSCTATPAPNDIMEYASQSSFLGKLRNEGDILWTYFNRNKRGVWQVKPHAKEGFYKFLSSFSIYIRNPASYGFNDNLKDLPTPEFHEIKIEATQEQREHELKIRLKGREGDLIGDTVLGVVKRTKLSEIAKGFIYEKDKKITRIKSDKPKIVADLIEKAFRNGEQILVWTVFDEEGEIILEHLKERYAERYEGFDDEKGCGVITMMEAKNLTGKMKEEERLNIIEDFRHGKLPCLISKPALLGFGLNFQFCSTMIFSGWDDSYERFYQALKRAHRFGQKKKLQVYLPYIPNLEGMILNNVIKKKNRFEEDAREHEAIFKKILAGRLRNEQSAAV